MFWEALKGLYKYDNRYAYIRLLIVCIYIYV